MSHTRDLPLESALARYAQLARRRPSPGRPRRQGWQSFAAAGASLAMSGAAEAAVQPFLPPAPLRIELADQSSGSASADIDLDFDGNLDFNFAISAELYQFTSMATTYTARRQAAVGGIAAENKVFGSYSSAFRVLSGSAIVETNAFIQLGNLWADSATTQGGSLLSSFGNWDPGYAGYLGVRFKIPNGGASSDEHFGWIRLETEANTSGLLAINIFEWAYEDIPGVGIVAGDREGAPPLVLGDYNGSGMVEPNDLALWTNTFGSEVVPGTGADGNSNGIVDAADYTVYQDNLGSDTPAGSELASSSHIPEPSACTLGVLALGAAGIAALRQNRRQDRLRGDAALRGRKLRESR